MRWLVPSLGLLIITLSASSNAHSANASPHYDKDQITSASKAFSGVAEQLQSAYLPLERELSRTDSLLAELDLNLALSAGSVDAAQHKLWTARLDERSGVFGPEFEAIQARIRTLEGGFEVAFQGALERALGSLQAQGIEAVPCSSKGGGLGSMAPGFARSGSQCPGEDLSKRIAEMWDQDPKLAEELTALTAERWPTVTAYEGASDAVTTGEFTAGEAWLSPSNLASAIPEAIELIDTIDRMANEARESLRTSYQGLDRDAPNFKDQRAAISSLAKGIRAFSEQAKAAAGEELFSSLQRARRKGRKAGWDGVVACLSSTGWGGCHGKDRTDEVAEVLSADRKLQKALAKLLANLEKPPQVLP